MNQLWKMARSFWLFFLNLIFPIECLGCGNEGQWLCPDCFKKINLKAKQYCLHCKKENDFGRFCPPCGINYSLTGVWIASLYDDQIVSEAVKSLKYRFVSALAGDLSKLLTIFINGLIERSRAAKSGLADGLDWRGFKKAQNLPQALLNFRENLVMPVPLSKKRLRWRGFNQSELLARVIAAEYNLEISRDLVRTKHKKPQAKLTELRRLENIKECFSWRGGNLNKKNVILVDDVVTTGATLNECAKVLKAHGAGEVWGLVVAKG